METQWLQLSIFNIEKHKNCISYHNFNLILSVLHNYFAWSKTLCLNKYYGKYLPQTLASKQLLFNHISCPSSEEMNTCHSICVWWTFLLAFLATLLQSNFFKTFFCHFQSPQTSSPSNYTRLLCYTCLGTHFGPDAAVQCIGKYGREDEHNHYPNVEAKYGSVDISVLSHRVH